MSTFDSEAQVRSPARIVPLCGLAEWPVAAETRQVIALIAKQNWCWRTGHPTAEEALLLVREGRERGVKHMVVTHAMMQRFTCRIRRCWKRLRWARISSSYTTA